MRRQRFVLAALAALVFPAASVFAQPPIRTQYVASSFSTLVSAGNSLVGIDAGGATTTIVPLVAPGTTPSSIGMAPTNDAVLVWDVAGIHRYDLVTGRITYTTLVNGGGNSNIHWGCVDEDGGMIWCVGTGTAQGNLYKALDTQGSLTTLLAVLPLQYLNAVCWIGSTGQYAAAQYSTLGGNVYILGRDGTILRVIPGLANLSGLDWSVWDDQIYASSFGNGVQAGVFRIDHRAGRATSLGPIGPLTATTNSIESVEQPVPRLLCSEYGGPPQHLWIMDPVSQAVTTLYAGNNQIGFSDAEVLGSRALWSVNAWKVGSQGRLSLNFGTRRGGNGYQLALSLSSGPGIPMGKAGVVHLALDSLFVLSLQIGAPIFFDFGGQLNAWGQAPRPPFVQIPNAPSLRGIRIYAGAIAYDSTGITAVSNVWGATIL